MGRPARLLLGGVAMEVAAIVLDLVGSASNELPLLILSFAVAIGGALVAVRGIIEFISSRL